MNLLEPQCLTSVGWLYETNEFQASSTTENTAQRSRNQKEEKDSPRRHKDTKKERKQQKEKEA
jgi:hypothetical protein